MASYVYRGDLYRTYYFDENDKIDPIWGTQDEETGSPSLAGGTILTSDLYSMATATIGDKEYFIARLDPSKVYNIEHKKINIPASSLNCIYWCTDPPRLSPSRPSMGMENPYYCGILQRQDGPGEGQTQEWSMVLNLESVQETLIVESARLVVDVEYVLTTFDAQHQATSASVTSAPGTWTAWDGLNLATDPQLTLTKAGDDVHTSRFGAIGLYSGSLTVMTQDSQMKAFDGRFIITGVSQDGTPIPSQNVANELGIIFISNSFFSSPIEEKAEEFDPGSSDNSPVAFGKNDMPVEGIAERNITDRNPYGLNSAYTGIVTVDKAGYTELIGNIFGDGLSGGLEEDPLIADPNVQGVLGGDRNINNKIRSAANSGIESLWDAITGQSAALQEKRQAMADAILSVNIFPNVFTGSASTISSLSGYKLVDPVTCTAISDEIVKKDFYAIIPCPNNSFVSFEPYTTFEVFCPFIGTVPIPMSVLWDNLDGTSYAKIHLSYEIDAYTGGVQCEVRIATQTAKEYTYCTKQGNCASPIPIIGSGRNGQAEKNIVGGIAGVAASLASFATGNPVAGVSNLTSGLQSLTSGATDLDKVTPVINSSNASVAAMLSPVTPYWVMTYKEPTMPEPTKYKEILGHMVNAQGNVGNFKGVCAFYGVNLDSVPATQAVKEQILARLMSEVII